MVAGPRNEPDVPSPHFRTLSLRCILIISSHLGVCFPSGVCFDFIIVAFVVSTN
jgi:hypothetical protein